MEVCEGWNSPGYKSVKHYCRKTLAFFVHILLTYPKCMCGHKIQEQRWSSELYLAKQSRYLYAETCFPFDAQKQVNQTNSIDAHMYIFGSETSP